MDDVVKALRKLADKIESGEVILVSTQIDNEIVDGPPRDGYKTYEATNNFTLSIQYALKNPAAQAGQPG